MAAITYKCPNCGGSLRFDPKSQKYKCDFCLSAFTEEQLAAQRPDSAEERKVSAEEAEYIRGGVSASRDPSGQAGQGTAAENSRKTSETAENGREEGKSHGAVVYTCPSCGASVITDENTAATFCYYCHSPIVLEGKLRGDYLPDRVIPFRYDKKQAEKVFLDYVGHKRFVPKDFFSKDQIEKLSGVYYPFLVYDCTLDGRLSARADQIRTWVSGDTEFTDTSVYQVERSGRIDIQNLSRNALSESDKNLIDSVMPFRLNEAGKFSLGYLQGFVAQKRDIESSEIAGEMQERAQKYAKSALRNTMKGYTTVTSQQASFSPEGEHYSYMLLPVWLLTYKAADGKKFYFAMNGQTGEIHGKLPIAAGRLLLTSGAVSAVIFMITLLITYLLF